MSSNTRTTVESSIRVIDAILADGLQTIPEPFEQTEFLSNEQHKWRLDNWGVKWDITNVTTVYNTVIQFDVPNSTVMEWAQKISLKMKCGITVTSENKEADFYEYVRFIDGKLTKRIYMEDLQNETK